MYLYIELRFISNIIGPVLTRELRGRSPPPHNSPSNRCGGNMRWVTSKIRMRPHGERFAQEGFARRGTASAWWRVCGGRVLRGEGLLSAKFLISSRTMSSNKSIINFFIFYFLFFPLQLLRLATPRLFSSIVYKL